jgi:hypothetical protein
MILVMISLLLAGCYKDDNVKEFVTGTYITEWKNEFNESRDTIIIEPLTNAGSKTYKITRKTFFHYTNLRKRKSEYKVLRWTGCYDEKQKTVMIHNSGRILSFDPAKFEMKMGTITYKKL